MPAAVHHLLLVLRVPLRAGADAPLARCAREHARLALAAAGRHVTVARGAADRIGVHAVDRAVGPRLARRAGALLAGGALKALGTDTAARLVAEAAAAADLGLVAAGALGRRVGGEEEEPGQEAERQRAHAASAAELSFPLFQQFCHGLALPLVTCW